jgi:GT2 family glycosyltransferase
VGEEKVWVRGATYGAFRPDIEGREYQDVAQIDRDFALMAASGFNAVRIPHTTPPRGLLDSAARHGLRVMVGLSAEQYVGFLADGRESYDIEGAVRAKVRTIVGHPALLGYAIGNEVPASIARWIGRRPLERYIRRLYDVVKTEDPTALVTYVNYPSTEYLDLPFLDFLSFNVYLESQERLEAYLGRLQNLVGDRPLLMTELGLDGLRNGEDAQARAIDWQIRTAFSEGCAGAFVFSWTDEWFRAGHQVEDWAFGLTRRDRSPKPALASAIAAFSEVPFSDDRIVPSVSVIVCTHNGSRTLRRCLEGICRLNYPNFEVIVVDDGSTDGTVAIVQQYDVRLISTVNKGLSSARNTGLEAATGEIVAYIDDDAYPDPDWLTYLADTFMRTSYVGVGGPNIHPGGDGVVADSVANAPGGPIHVLLTDRVAEHIPGCNMSFRASALREIGGFDPQFVTAGDDVDVCWRLQEGGGTLGFNPAAMVWHRRRTFVRAYWRQQLGYGRAEAMLERKWPEKYNSVGHLTWSGRLYGAGLAPVLGTTGRPFHGIWGAAPFQSLYQPASSVLGALPLMPEWYLLMAALALVGSLGMVWPPLLAAWMLLVVCAGASIARASVAAGRASFQGPVLSRRDLLARRVLTGVLHLLQPLARLHGRITSGLTPWRLRAPAGVARPWPREFRVWTDEWQEPRDRLQSMEDRLKFEHARVSTGGAFDRWDLEVRSGFAGCARVLMGVEDHGAGRQYIRVRCWPRVMPRGVVAATLACVVGITALADSAWLIAATFLGVGALLMARSVLETAVAMAVAERASQQATDANAGGASRR